jgi:hypothetical protein
MTSSRAVAMAGVVTIALAGCGGSSNKQLSYSAFVSKANAVCRNARAEFSKAGSPGEAAPILDKYVKKFKDLKPPDQLKSPYNRFISTSDRQVALLKKGDTAGYNKLNAETDNLARQMGATDCAQ